MKKYLKHNFWGWLLCSAAAAGLDINLYNGYKMTDALSGNFAAVLILMAGVAGVCTLLSCHRKVRRFSIAAAAAVLIAAILFMQKTHPFLHEEEQSGAIFWILLLLVGVGSFLLTKTRTGCFLFLAAGNFIIAVEVFLDFGLHRTGYVVFLCCGAGMLFFRVYHQGISGAAVAKVQPWRYAVQIICVCGLAMLVSLAGYYGIVRPLRPPTQELKLIRQLKSMDIVHKVGMSSLLPDLNEDLVSNDAPTESRTASGSSADASEDKSKDASEDESIEETQKEPDNSPKEQEENTPDESIEVEAKAVRYDKTRVTWLIVCAALIGLFISCVRLKKYLRRSRLQKLSALPRREAVLILYPYLVKVLGRVGVRREKTLTLREFAYSGRKDIGLFIYGDYDFSDLTGVYEKAFYGHGAVSEQEWQMYAETYEEFYYNIKDELGKWRYAWLFFRI